MEKLLASTALEEEKRLENAITAAYVFGAKQKNIRYITATVENRLSLAYCRTQKEFGIILQAIKQEKLENPRAAKAFNAILSNLYSVSREGKQLLDYFLQIWKEMMKTIQGGPGDNRKLISVVAPILKRGAPESGEMMARMMFAKLRKLRDAVCDAANKIEIIKRKWQI